MNITVYLGANAGNDPALAEAVRELGSWIGANGTKNCGSTPVTVFSGTALCTAAPAAA